MGSPEPSKNDSLNARPQVGKVYELKRHEKGITARRNLRDHLIARQNEGVPACLPGERSREAQDTNQHTG